MLPRSPRSNLSAFLDRREIDELSSQAVRQWPICNHDVIRQRYDRIAAFIPIFEWAFFILSGLRKRAVGQLKLDGAIESSKWAVGPAGIFPISERLSDPRAGFMVSICLKE